MSCSTLAAPPQARSERESFTQLYTEDIAKYDAAEHGLCFGRIDVRDDEDGDATEVRYVGRLGILDETNDYEPLLLDWRAPLARPFYLATPAAPEGVTRRRHIRSRRRAITALNDEYLDLDAAQAHDATVSAGGVAGESALLAALNAARTGQMQDIVATIQAEQDAIIRSEHKSVLVVQGGPGTGKTAVALHRAAFLLYTYRRQLAKSGVLIVGPNSTFLDYIGQVLPSLGETGVLLSTIGDLYPGVRATVEDSLEAGTVKGSLDMVEVLKKAVRDRQEVPATPIPLVFDTYRLTLDRKTVTRARGRARSSRRPHNLARPIFVAAVVDALADQLASIIGADPVGGANLLSREDIDDIRTEMRSDRDIVAAIDSLWPQLSPQQVLAELFASRERLASAAPELDENQRELLLRPTATRVFSAADAPLLDELAELLGVDDAAERERAARQWRRQIADAQGALDILTGSAPQDLEDDLDPEILMAYDLIDADQLAQRQGRSSHETTAERAAGDRTWTYGHVIVDEAQELSAMAWRMLMRRIPNRWMTLVGDTAQTGGSGRVLVLAADPRAVRGQSVEEGRADRQLPHARGDHGDRPRGARRDRPASGAAPLGARVGIRAVGPARRRGRPARGRVQRPRGRRRAGSDRGDRAARAGGAMGSPAVGFGAGVHGEGGQGPGVRLGAAGGAGRHRGGVASRAQRPVRGAHPRHPAARSAAHRGAARVADGTGDAGPVVRGRRCAVSTSAPSRQAVCCGRTCGRSEREAGR